jgi:hypothetical protein
MNPRPIRLDPLDLHETDQQVPRGTVLRVSATRRDPTPADHANNFGLTVHAAHSLTIKTVNSTHHQQLVWYKIVPSRL